MGLFSSNSGSYYTPYLKKDGKYISLEEDAKDFCEKWIRPVNQENWDWTKRDFEKQENKPTLAEAKAIGIIVFDDLSKKKDTQVDLSTLNNAKAISAYFDPESDFFNENMEEFAYALEVELEHGKIRDANVTANHPFLTAMVVLAHMSESLSYYPRLKVMETEAEIYEIKRKLADKLLFTDKLKETLSEKENALTRAKGLLEMRLKVIDQMPVMENLED